MRWRVGGGWMAEGGAGGEGEDEDEGEVAEDAAVAGYILSGVISGLVDFRL